MRLDTKTKGYVSILAKNWKKKAEKKHDYKLGTDWNAAETAMFFTHPCHSLRAVLDFSCVTHLDTRTDEQC